jgi:hypothetical protein
MSGQLPDMRKRKSDEPIVATRHLLTHRWRHGFFGAEPCQVERLLGGLAVTIDRHHEGEAHSVLTRVVEPASIGIGEVLDEGERRRVDGDSRQCDWSEVFFTVPQERIANSLTEQHSPAHHHARDRAVGRHPQQHADFGDIAVAVDTNRNRIDVDDR